jgi:nitrilase
MSVANQPVRVAVAQMSSGAELGANLRTAGELLARAAGDGASLAVLPENFAFMGATEDARLAVAEAYGGGPIQDFLAEQSRRLDLWVVGGTLPLRAADGARARAACLVYDSTGQPVARYDKIHLFDVELPDGGRSYRESAATLPGTTPVVVAGTPLGALGLAVCYDIRFPELFRALQTSGCDGFALPAAFTRETGAAHWEVLLRARAVENQCCLLAAAQTGEHAGGRLTYGDSMIVDAWGRVLARAGSGTKVLLADIDLEYQRQLRERFPALRHRRLASGGPPGPI